MDKDKIIKEVFEIAMHSIRNEQIFLQQDAMTRYMENIKKPEQSATSVLTYNNDILRAEQSINQRREWLYKLMDEFYKED